MSRNTVRRVSRSGATEVRPLFGGACCLHAGFGLGFGRTVTEGRVSRPDGQVENQVGVMRERLLDADTRSIWNAD